ITTIFVNNAIYGMTGGQMAPTTLPGQRATTCQSGRDTAVAGSPIRMSEILATLDGAGFVERVTVHNPAAVRKAKTIIKKAFQNQIEGKGFSIVEVLSTCPTNWGISPIDSLKWLEENMIPYYPLGNKKEAK
ncbi:MAG: thiamine pyrophosphate-dependent enzyme, partial [Fusobacteriaceae bacterium]